MTIETNQTCDADGDTHAANDNVTNETDRNRRAIVSSMQFPKIKTDRTFIIALRIGRLPLRPRRLRPGELAANRRNGVQK